ATNYWQLLRMTVGVLQVELRVHDAMSLKDKRRVVKSMIDRVHQRFRVSIAETGHHDLHQRAEIAIAVVAAGGEREMEKLMDEIRNLVESDPEVYLTLWDPQILEGEG
ncbi:MAG TPA: DUF503 domain-containing protein, partial [Thermoanaerobaculia bacterium]